MNSIDPWQLLRYIMIAGGTVLAAKTPNISEGDVQGIVGGIIALGGALWGVYTRWNTAAVPTATATAADIPVKSSATGMIKTGPGV